MKTLLPKQQWASTAHLYNLRLRGASLDTSETGTGKTVVSCDVAKHYPNVCVVCPKIVIPAWSRELKEVGVTPLFILNYEKLRTGNTQFLSKEGKKKFTWNLPDDTLIIWDEVHYCKGATSQNSEMLIAATKSGINNLMLSATAAKDPTEMRAIGYALGLHNLAKDRGPTLKSWFRWMKEYGCRMDPFRNWVAGGLRHLVRLNEILYNGYAVKLTTNDLPNSFMDNRVITKPLSFDKAKEIVEAYSNVVSETLIGLVAEDREPSPSVLTEILRARQIVEAAKVPETCVLVEQALDEGFSVVVFVSFSDTINMYLNAFPNAAVIRGGQTSAEREANVQSFQSNEKRIIICNSAAGGTGVSLHDIHGGHPRMTFINPSYNIVEYTQVLGRTYRNGAKSNTIQNILVAADTIEEEIISAIERKRLQLSTLHGKTTPATAESTKS